MLSNDTSFIVMLFWGSNMTKIYRYMDTDKKGVIFHRGSKTKLEKNILLGNYIILLNSLNKTS